jgi:hypothetical protein
MAGPERTDSEVGPWFVVPKLILMLMRFVWQAGVCCSVGLIVGPPQFRFAGGAASRNESE